MVGAVLSRVHLNDEFVSKTDLAEVEHRFEHVYGVFVKKIYKFRLLFGWQLLIKFKLFDDHVVVSD